VWLPPRKQPGGTRQSAATTTQASEWAPQRANRQPFAYLDRTAQREVKCNIPGAALSRRPARTLYLQEIERFHTAVMVEIGGNSHCWGKV
jgi:hypothetical protein